MSGANPDGHFALEETIRTMDALSQPSRLEAFRLLVRYLPFGLPAGDIARLLAVTHNTLSTHLAVLEQAGLVRSRREGRSIIYAADVEPARGLAAFILRDCCSVADVPPGLLASAPAAKAFPTRREVAPRNRPLNVLVICSGNSARSLLAEALLKREGEGMVRAYSAGSRPANRPAEPAIMLLESLGYATEGLHPKSWRDFASPDAPRMDVVVTVCDTAAAESAPSWPGRPLTVHWGLPDPVVVDGADAEKKSAYLDAYRRLAARITTFVNLDFTALDRRALKTALTTIGRMEGATDFTLRAVAGR